MMFAVVTMDRLRRRRRLTGLCLAAALCGTGAAAQPRPLSAAEEAAVGLAVRYLEAGPGAWLDHLAAAGPLGALDPAAAEAEIGVRAGPPEAARWLLQTPAPGQPEGRAVFSIELPSGLGEVLVLDLVPGAAGWEIGRLRCLAEPWGDSGAALPALDGGGALAGDAAAGDAAAGGADPPAGAAPARGAGLGRILLLVALGLVLVPLLLLFGWESVRGRRASLLLLALGAAGALHAACGGGGPAAGPAAAATPADPAMVRLGELWPLRRALATGAPQEEVDRLLAAVPADGPLHAAVTLWRAELALQQTDLSQAAAVVAARPDPDPVPLGSLLRARLAFLRAQPEAAAAAFEQAMRRGPDHDGIRLEAADALGMLGESGQMEIGYELLVRMGTRLAEPYYGSAKLALLQGDDEAAAGFLRRAWGLHPMERGELLSDTLLAWLVTRPELFPLFELGAPLEPRLRPVRAAERRLEPMAAAAAWTSGEMLRLEVGPARLTVPGGAGLAPAGTPVLGADGERRREEEEALGRLAALLAEARGVGGLADPRRRTETMAAAAALARRNRWPEVATLTEGLDAADLDPVPGDLVLLRAVALDRTGRDAEARRLLVRLAQSDLANRRRDPTALYLLAELMAADGEHELALQLIRKGDAISPIHRNRRRIAQLEMQQRLAAAYAVLETDHFRLVYPRLTGDRYARQLGVVLEEEHRRLSRWIPVPPGPPIEVHLYPLRDFLGVYSGAALVVGLYDGVVRVPFADVRSLDPELVAILSHEVGHAMIARATDDRAPRWFHEGVAEHVQMSQDWANPFPDLHATSRVLAFPLIEPILAGFAEPQLIELAYGEAAWFVHYLEARHGVGVFHRLLEAFRAGMDTEEALANALGMSPEAYHQAVLGWALDEAPGAWPTEVRRYDREYDLPFERAATAAPARGGHLRRPPGSDHADLRARLAAWHRTWSREVAAFKQALGALAGDLETGRVDGHRHECAALARQVAALRFDNRLFDCPLADAGIDLRSAFDGFQAMAAACETGDALQTIAAYRRAERELAAAAQDLRPYGFQP